ncbi:uncharacterized protein H6S33_003385 [Morchella sextelata]|uniref:uncharacterized protein n=1 Tax=Morchella sextelata TaxID=1174677 RepID=UPI001D05B657|nr:uncharacterized protein H6S33_003385 [Morchella sextelata]KAH0606551.1 hypothetical protein H6S33_003385 [Morchella sextelata]
MSYESYQRDTLPYRYGVNAPLGDVELLRDDYSPRRLYRNRPNRDDTNWPDFEAMYQPLRHLDFVTPTTPPQPQPQPQPAPRVSASARPKRRFLRAALGWFLEWFLTVCIYLVFYNVKKCLEGLSILLSDWDGSLHRLNTWASSSKAQASHYTTSKLPPLLQQAWSSLSQALPPLLHKAHTATSRLAAHLYRYHATALPPLLHASQAALTRLLHASQAALTQLPPLLRDTAARTTQLLHHARSAATGTPACRSAECLRIAARTTRFVAEARELAVTALVALSLLLVIVAAQYAHTALAKLVHGVLRVLLLGEKWASSSSSDSSSSSSSATGASAGGGGVAVSGGATRRAVLNVESLQRRAESVSLLMEVFGRTVGDGGGEVQGEQRAMVAMALRDVVSIGKELGIEEAAAAAVGGGAEGQTVETETGTGTETGEGVCVVCYDGVADMVVLPCKHLALCVTCCDGMSIRERGGAGHGNAKCPICRAIVTDRMKIFRS